MLLLLLTAVVCAAPDAGVTTDAESDAPGFEMILPEKMIEDLLSAAAPFDREVKKNAGFLGDVRFNVRLKNPRVKVTPSGIHVTLDYYVSSASGLGTSGTARPRLELKPDENSGDLIARLVDATISSTGITLPLEQAVEPIRLPASATGPLQLNGRTIEASGRAERVVLENGRVRVIGSWSFRPVSSKK